MMGMKAKRRLHTIIFHVLVGGIAIFMFYPIAWMFFSSFKPTEQVMTTVAQLFPGSWTLENYATGWKGFGGITFATFFKNSFFITILSTAGAVISSTMVAYGFARANFIFMIMQFIEGIPRDLDEAANMDGCSPYTIFTRIIVPLVKPAMVTCAIFEFYWKWDDYMGSLLYLNSPEKYTVSIALKNFTDPMSSSDYGAMFAMCVLSLLPVIIIFMLLQKYIVEGVASTGIKG